MLFSRLNETFHFNKTRNSSGDEIANVNFLYDDIVLKRRRLSLSPGRRPAAASTSPPPRNRRRATAASPPPCRRRRRSRSRTRRHRPGRGRVRGAGVPRLVGDPRRPLPPPRRKLARPHPVSDRGAPWANPWPLCLRHVLLMNDIPLGCDNLRLDPCLLLRIFRSTSPCPLLHLLR